MSEYPCTAQSKKIYKHIELVFLTDNYHTLAEMYITRWVSFAAAVSIARAFTDYCVEPAPESGTSDDTPAFRNPNTNSQEPSVTQANQISYAEISRTAGVEITRSFLAPAATATLDVLSNTASALEQSASNAYSAPTLSSEPSNGTASAPTAEITASDAFSASAPIPSLTASKHATIHPAMALCGALVGLCPSNSTTEPTSNGGLDSSEDVDNKSDLFSIVTLLRTSTQTITSRRGLTTDSQHSSRPPIQRARRACASANQSSWTQSSQSVLESASPGAESESASQGALSVPSESALQSMGPMIESSTAPVPIQVSDKTDEAFSMTSTVSQAYSIAGVTVHSTKTAVSSLTTATPASHHSGSGRAFGLHAGKAIVLGCLVTMSSCLLF